MPDDWEARQRHERAAQRIFAAAYDAQQRRIVAVLRRTKAAPDGQVWSDEEPRMTQAVLPFYDEVLTAAARQALTIGADWDQVNQAVLSLAQAEAARFAQQATATSRAQVAQVVADWITTGGTLADLTERVGRVWSGPRAAVAAATEVTRLYAQGNTAAWQASGVVDAVEWRTTEDERVCPICGPKANTRRLLGSSDIPPAHPNCRCWIVPQVRDAA